MLNNKKNNLLLVLTIIIIVAAGLYFRLKGLGRWPLAVDEFYLMKSVDNILKYGLPKFHFSGYYDRGILYQYIISLLLLSGVKAEFAGRIVSVAANLATLIPIYLLAKKISGKTLAVILIFIFSFSVWEIEMARFIRMYTPFQAVFAFYIYFLYKNLVEDDQRALIWMLLLSFLSIFIYEASIFLALLNFIPIFWDKEQKSFSLSHFFKLRFNKIYFAFACLAFIGMYLYLSTDFRTLGSTETQLLPAHVINSDEADSDSGGHFRMPKILILSLFSGHLLLLLSVIPILIVCFSIYKIFKRDDVDISSKYSCTVLIILSFLNLFGLVVLLFVLLYLIDWLKKNSLIKVWQYLLVPVLLNFIFLSLFALKTTAWHHYFPGSNFSSTSEIFKVVWKEFLNYPNLYEMFALFRDTIPVSTYLVIGILTAGFLLIFFKEKEGSLGLRIIFSLFMFLILLVNILNLAYFKTRYFFFIYPLTMILVYSTILNYSGYFFRKNNYSLYAFLIAVAFTFVLSEDFSLNHLMNIDSDRIIYRESYSKDLKDHYYPRWDTRTPAEIINDKSGKQDIIIINSQVNSFYLNRLDYVYIDFHGGNFKGVSVDRGTKERWTNANLIDNYGKLNNLLLHSKNNKWFIVNTFWGKSILNKANFFSSFKKFAVYSNPDSSAVLYKIPGNL